MCVLLFSRKPESDLAEGFELLEQTALYSIKYVEV